MKGTLAVLMLSLAMGAATTSAAGQLGGVVDGVKHVGEATKDGVKTAGEATKEGAKKTADAVTGKAHAKCADGTTQTAKTEHAASAACAKHGGVAK